MTNTRKMISGFRNFPLAVIVVVLIVYALFSFSRAVQYGWMVIGYSNSEKNDLYTAS